MSELFYGVIIVILSVIGFVFGMVESIFNFGEKIPTGDRIWRYITFSIFHLFTGISIAICTLIPIVVVYVYARGTFIEFAILILYVIFYYSVGKEVIVKHIKPKVLKFIKKDKLAFQHLILGVMMGSIVTIIVSFIFFKLNA